MPTEQGYSNQKKIGRAQFKTIIPLGSDQFGQAVALKSLTQYDTQAIVSVALSDDQKVITIELNNHNAKVGDVIKFFDGNLSDWEIPIDSIVDNDSVTIANIGPALPTTTDTVYLLRWVFNKASSSGAFVFSEDGKSISNAPFRNSYSMTPVTTAAYVQLVASTTSETNLLDIFDSSGQTLVLAVGGAGSEVDQIYIVPGGNEKIPLKIPAGSRVSVKAISGNASSGELVINFLG